MHVFGVFLSVLYFGVLIALSVITPSWRWVLGIIIAVFIGQGVAWMLVWAGFQPIGMSIHAVKEYLFFITSVAAVGAVLYGLAVLWSYGRAK